MSISLNQTWGHVFLNGRLIPADEAAVSAFDRGFLYGDGLYETMRVYAGRPFMLDAHLQRMEAACDTIGLAPVDLSAAGPGVLQVIKKNGLTDAYVRITLTRGATGNLWHEIAFNSPSLLIIGKPYQPPCFGDGCRLVVSTFRTDERSPLCGIKQIGILPKMMARAEAIRKGAYDAVLLDTRGFVSEGTSWNVFWIRDGRLYTPCLECGILAGITRRIVLEIAREQGIPVEEGEFPLDEMLSADEVFMTSSTWELAPARSLEDTTFRTGPITRRFQEWYRARTG